LFWLPGKVNRNPIFVPPFLNPVLTFLRPLGFPLLFRSVIILVKAGSPVDQTVEALMKFMEPGDVIIDGGNEWYGTAERKEQHYSVSMI
jgi:6-phosphogluconate dehydrogenase